MLFLAKGSNVELSINTPILLRVNEGLQMSSDSQEVEDFRQCQPEPLMAYTFTGETL